MISITESLAGFFRSRAELIAISTLLSVVFALEINAALQGAAQGQDFYEHRRITEEVAKEPLKWVFETRRRVDPPGFYLISAAIFRLAGPARWVIAMGIIGAVINTLALLVLYLVSRLLIQSSILRICAVCLAGLLPGFMVPSVVIAADTLCQLPCLLMVYFAGLAFTRRIGLWPAFIVAILAAVFCIGCKFVGLALIPAFIGTMFFAALSKRLSLLKCALGTFLFLGVTVPFQTALLFQSSKGVAEPFVQMHVRKLQLRTALFFRSGDVGLFNAPSHWQMALSPKTDPISFRHLNRFSYPALLCLGTFTDILDLFQSKVGLEREPKESYKGGALVGRRSRLNQRLMKISIRTGAVFAVCAAFCLPFFGVASLFRLFRQKSERDLLWLSAALLGTA